MDSRIDVSMFLPAAQAVGCRCVAVVAAGSVPTREKQQGPGWSWDMRGWGPGSGVPQPAPAALLGVLPMGLPPCS